MWFGRSNTAVDPWYGGGKGDELRTITTVVVGGAAGNFTVTGIDPTKNKIVQVLYFAGTATPTLTGETDITGQFTITALNTINNTGGTNTTNGVLNVVWR